MSHRSVSEYRRGLREIVNAAPATIFGVANFHGLRNSDQAPQTRQFFHEWDKRLSSSLLGRDWLKLPAERPAWRAVPEMSGHVHHNMYVDCSPALMDRFMHEAPRVFSKVVPGGDLWLRPIADEDDLGAVRGYPFKDGKGFSEQWTYDNLQASIDIRRKGTNRA